MNRARLLIFALLLTACASARAERDSGGGIVENGSGAGSLQILENGTVIAKRARLNLADGSGMSIVCVDDTVNKRVNCTFTSSGGGDPILNQSTLQSGTTAFPEFFRTEHVGISTPTADGVKINERATSDTVFERIFLDSTASLFSNFTFLQVYSNHPFATTPALKGAFRFNVNVGNPQLAFLDVNGTQTFLYDMVSGQTSFGKGVGAYVANNSAMFNGSIGVTEFDVTGSTTIPTYSSPDYAQVGYIYRIDASGGNSTVTLEQTTVPYLPYGRLRKVCKGDSSGNTVTIGSTVLTVQNQCAEFVVRAPSPGNSGIWTNVGTTYPGAPDLSAYVAKADIPTCDETTERLHWNGSAFSCVTDQTGGGGGGSSSPDPVTATGSGVSVSGSAFTDVASIVVSSGTWIISGTFFTSTSGAGGQANDAVSAYSANDTTDHVLGQNLTAAVSGDGGGHNAATIAGWVVTPSVTTTYYAKVNPNGASGSAWATITAVAK